MNLTSVKSIPVRQIKPEQDETESLQSFSIRQVQDMLAGKDMVQDLHRHDFFFLLALKKGRGTHTIDFNPYKIVNHSIFFTRPGQVHQLLLNKESTGFLMGFKSDFYYPTDKMSTQLLRNASTLNVCNLSQNNFNKLFSLLTFVHKEYKEKKEGYKEVIKANLSIFFIELIRHRTQKQFASNNINQHTHEQFDRLMELIESNISTHKEVVQYAAMLNLSTYQLNAVTKSLLGKTCSEVINDYIILESKRYLLATSNLVNQIAFHLGYEDVSYFIRFFKKHTGYTPEAFRQNFK